MLVVVLGVAGCAQEPPPRWTEPVTSMEFALIPAGTFVAGSPASETGHQDDEVLYPIRVAHPFYVATHEVTASQWTRVMHPDAPPLEPAVARLPVVNITWHEARVFLDRLNAGQAWRLRLP